MITPAKNKISTENLTIGYPTRGEEGRIVKKGLTLNACQGELIALIGGNGAGKSTLLKTLTGFQPALSGNIKINGKLLTDFHEKELARLLSFVSTEIVKVSNLSVFELVALGRYPHTSWSGKLGDEDRKAVKEAINLVGLTGYEDRMINFISDGERQKAMIARTLAQDTDIIILDEPTAFLDLSNKYEIIHILQILANKKGKTIIFSTHDLSTAIDECDKIWLMLEDQIKEGSPEDLILNGSFSLLFDNRQLYFDEERGVFRINKKSGKKIFISGEGPRLNWTTKALERIGFEVQEKIPFSEKEIVEIEILQSSWIIKNQDDRFQFNSLYSLCGYLKQ